MAIFKLRLQESVASFKSSEERFVLSCVVELNADIVTANKFKRWQIQLQEESFSRFESREKVMMLLHVVANDMIVGRHHDVFNRLLHITMYL